MRPNARPLAALVLAVTAVMAVSGCAGSATPTDSGAGWAGPSGSAGSSGGAHIVVTGAVKTTIDKLGSCSAGGSVLQAIYQSSAGTIYFLQIGSDHVDNPGQMPVGKDVSTSVFLSDANGDAWDSAESGASGHVTVDAGLRSGSLDVTLVNPVDGSTAHATGSWSCSRG